MNRILKVMLAISVSVILMVQSPGQLVIAKTTAELQEELERYQEQEQLNEEAKEDNLYQQELARAFLFEINDSMNSLESDILLLDAEIDGLRKDFDDKELEIAIIEDDLIIVKEEEAAYREQMAQRMKIMYEYGEVAFVQILFESKDLGDFFNRLEYISKIFNYDQKMFDKLEEMQREITATEASLAVDSFELEAIIESTELKKAEANIMYEEKAVLMEMIESTQSILEAKQIELEAAEAEIDDIIEATFKAIEESKRKWIDGELDWPTPGYNRITSEFGYRIHPIKGTRLFHAGIDIAVPYGGAIRAAELGEVIASYYSSSYGNVVIISHGYNDGEAFSTLYAHNSKNLVSTGDTVNAGDLIAYAGSTGWSTGPHLHFGVKKGTEWVDPLEYFTKNN